jgi:hypothetical protein
MCADGLAHVIRSELSKNPVKRLPIGLGVRMYGGTPRWRPFSRSRRSLPQASLVPLTHMSTPTMNHRRGVATAARGARRTATRRTTLKVLCVGQDSPTGDSTFALTLAKRP